MKTTFVFIFLSLFTAACGLLDLLPDYGNGHARIEQYKSDLDTITAEAERNSAAVDSALYKTQGYVQVISIEAQFQQKQINMLLRQKSSAPVR